MVHHTTLPPMRSDLFVALSGGDLGVISAGYGGFRETPSLADIRELYDFFELWCFAVGSWSLRFNNAWKDESSMHDLFRQGLGSGTPWVKKHMRLDDELQTRLDELSPYEGEALKERCEMVEDRTVRQLRAELAGPGFLWVQGCRYRHLRGREERARLASKLDATATERNGRIVPSYAKAIYHLTEHFPRHCVPIEALLVPVGGQSRLF